MGSNISTLGDFLDSTGGSIQTGPFGTKLKASEYTPTGVPVISVGEVGVGRLRLHDRTPKVDESVWGRMPEYILKEDDIVFGRKGAVERSAQVQANEDGYFLGSDGIRVRLAPESCSPKFISYQLQDPAHKEWMIQHAAGTTMPSLNEGIIRRIPILLPPLPEQKAIAHILGSLDDKIELNRKMNATLESMAQALFNSWFVDFDPVIDNALAAGNPIPDEFAERAEVRRQALANGAANREAAKQFPDSFQETEEMGWIPEGWEVKSIADVTHAVTKGDTPRQDAISAALKDDKMVNLLRVNSITENGEILMDKLQQIPESIHNGKSKRSRLREGYILYTNAGTIGRVSYVQKDILPANTNQAIAIIQPDISLIPSKFLYMVMRQSAFQDSLHHDITQAVQANLALGKISKASFTFPDKNSLLFTCQILEKLLDRIWANRRAADNWIKLRDNLLPKLISGELRIPEAEQLSEEARP